MYSSIGWPACLAGLPAAVRDAIAATDKEMAACLDG
jgi:hypothetical protein